ncbi:hypothetical protein GQ457_06G007100 [Hibiscus cannabinus]
MRVLEALQWIRPPLGWLKVNVDGAIYSSANRVSIGGVIRDCNVLFAELWAIHDMLLHSWCLGFRQIELETDNLESVRILKGVSIALSGHSIVASIKELLAFDWEVLVRHIYREQNKVVDWLASMTKSSPIGATHLVDPPEGIHPLLQYDLSLE